MLQMAMTFFIVTIAWVFFRSPSVMSAVEYIQGIFTASMLSMPTVEIAKLDIILLLVFFATEWFQREKEHGLQMSHGPKGRLVRWIIYYALFSLILNNKADPQQFIYFQF